MNNFFIHKFRSQFLKKVSLVVISVLLLAFAGIRLIDIKTIEASPLYIPTDEEKVFELTNNERLSNNLNPLAWDYSLYLAARAKAYHMFRYDYFDHIASNGTTPWDFIRGSGYYYTVAGENLAIDFYDFNNLMSAWMNSPTHKDNILDKDFANIGIAVIRGDFHDSESLIVVQMFGHPSSR